MWPFSKKDSYNIDGREIVIKNKSKVKDVKFLIKAIKINCKTLGIPKRFPKITFILETTEENKKFDEDTWGLLIIDNKKTINPLIYVNIDCFKKFKNEHDNNSFIQRVGEFIAHELTHAWQETVSKTLTKREMASRRTAVAIRRKLSSIVDKEPNLKDIRQFLLIFIQGIQIEGLALYISRTFSGKVFFSEEIFQEVYLNTKQKGNEFYVKFNNFLPDVRQTKKFDSLVESMKEDMYYLGFHTVYSIFYIKKEINIKKLIKLSPYKFIREYEAAMKMKGLRPVVSLTSGNGILDYNKMVAEWWATAKAKEKQVKRAA